MRASISGAAGSHADSDLIGRLLIGKLLEIHFDAVQVAQLLQMLFVEGGSSDYVVNTNDVQSCVEFLGIAAGGLCRGAITSSTAVAAGRRGGYLRHRSSRQICRPAARSW